MVSNSLQIQSVLYHNQKSSLLKALDSLCNAIEVNRKRAPILGLVRVCYGDASKEPVFSTAEIEEITKKYSGQFEFQYRFFNENTGSAKGHNRLGQDCKTDYMLIMNPDVVVCPRFFEKMFSFFEKPELQTGMVEAKHLPVEHPKEYDKKTLETDWATTACALFPTGLFHQLNGFDSDLFFMYCDDLDFSWRIRLLGKKIYYSADCPVYHAKTLSPDGKWVASGAEVFYSAQAALLMAYKWSNHSLLRKLHKTFSESSDDNLKHAAEHFEKMQKNNQLPQPLDPEHRVAKFVGNNYTEHRFVL